MERLIKDFNQSYHEYPLKVVSVSDFFSHMNELLWHKVIKEQLDEYNITNSWHKINSDHFESKQLRDTSIDKKEEVVIFFVDSDIYRDRFSNSNIKLIKNIVILNR